MAWNFTTPQIGMQPITDHNTVQKHPLGTIVRASDPTFGEGEFIYLLGVASTVVGLAVTYNASTWQTTLLPNTNFLAASVAWAMSACVAAEYGWYQIDGLVTAKKTNVSWEPQKAAFISATAGRVMDTATSIGKEILNCKSANLTTTTTTTSTILLQVNRPCLPNG